MKQWANRKCDVKKRNSHRHFSARFCKNGVRWRNKQVTFTVATVLSLFNQKGTYLVIVTKYNRDPFLQSLTGPWSFPEYTSFLSNSFEDYRLQLLSEVIHSSKKLFKSPLFEHTYAQRVAFLDSAGIQRGTFSCKSKSIKASYTMEYSRDFT